MSAHFHLYLCGRIAAEWLIFMSKNEFTCDCNIVHQEVVADTLAQMPGEERIGKLAAFYKIMGDPTRCKIICALLQRELCVCDLANVLSMTKSSISHQLSKMRGAGVVKCRRSGKEVYYSLDDDHVAQLITLTMTHIQHKSREV